MRTKRANWFNLLSKQRRNVRHRQTGGGKQRFSKSFSLFLESVLLRNENCGTQEGDHRNEDDCRDDIDIIMQVLKVTELVSNVNFTLK